MCETGVMHRYVIRDVWPEDAQQIAVAHVAIWKATYPGMVDQTKLDSFDITHALARRRQSLGTPTEQAARGIRAVCAALTATGETVGFATSGPARDDDPPAPTELWSLNVLPDHHGSGIALDLMTAVLGGTDVPAYLWVVRDNARAVAFYGKHGFELDGVTRFDPDWYCHESRMTTTHLSGH